MRKEQGREVTAAEEPNYIDLRSALADPNVPEEEKALIRQALGE